MIIALCGMEGSDKSNLASALKYEFEQRGIMSVIMESPTIIGLFHGF
jgi:thymidylate kinase